MQPVLFGEELFYGLPIHIVRNAAVDGADGSALGFFVEALALGAFIRNDIVGIDTDGSVALAGIDGRTVEEGKGSFDAAAVGDRPFHATFVDGIVWTLGLTGTTIDTFFCYLNSHFFDN